ncbi:MAG: hypothetical protein ACKVP3_25450 [Hyphomicrobiaceae bacterium]
MEGSFSSNRFARFLLSAAFVFLAFVLIAVLMPRGGAPEDIAVHFAGPGSFPIVPREAPEQTSASRK